VTRDEQRNAAIELIAPPPRDRAEWLHDISVALDSIDFTAAATCSFKLARSKAGKKKLETYRAALERVQHAYRALPPAIRPWFSLAAGPRPRDPYCYRPSRPTLPDIRRPRCKPEEGRSARGLRLA